jgi:hypothetical protein
VKGTYIFFKMGGREEFQDQLLIQIKKFAVKRLAKVERGLRRLCTECLNIIECISMGLR